MTSTAAISPQNYTDPRAGDQYIDICLLSIREGSSIINQPVPEPPQPSPAPLSLEPFDPIFFC
jgi:hypothetical protein